MVHPPKHFRALALRSIRTARLPPTHSSHFHTLGLRLAAWYDIGNMGNYGQPEHYELPANGIGSKPKDHVTKTWDKNNIQNTYSYDGRETKMNVDALRRNGREEEEMGGAAITQRDRHGANRRAQRDVPEAPGPVIGMNDERGAVSCFLDGREIEMVVLRSGKSAN